VLDFLLFEYKYNSSISLAMSSLLYITRKLWLIQYLLLRNSQVLKIIHVYNPTVYNFTILLPKLAWICIVYLKNMLRAFRYACCYFSVFILILYRLLSWVYINFYSEYIPSFILSIYRHNSKCQLLLFDMSVSPIRFHYTIFVFR